MKSVIVQPASRNSESAGVIGASVAAHTAGPWQASNGNGGRNICSLATNVILADVHSPAPYDPDNRERIANAQLMAAAPGLLAALEKAAGMISSEYCSHAGRCGPVTKGCYADFAYAAIARCKP